MATCQAPADQQRRFQSLQFRLQFRLPPSTAHLILLCGLRLLPIASPSVQEWKVSVVPIRAAVSATKARMEWRCALAGFPCQSWWMSEKDCRRRKARTRDLCLCLKRRLSHWSAMMQFNGPSAPTISATEVREIRITNDNRPRPVVSARSCDQRSDKANRLRLTPADRPPRHHHWSSQLRRPALLSPLSSRPNVPLVLLMFALRSQRTSPIPLQVKVDSRDDCSVH